MSGAEIFYTYFLDNSYALGILIVVHDEIY